jgi:hypothetical protein
LAGIGHEFAVAGQPAGQRALGGLPGLLAGGVGASGPSGPFQFAFYEYSDTMQSKVMHWNAPTEKDMADIAVKLIDDWENELLVLKRLKEAK